MKQCDESDEKQSFEPSEAWLDEFEKQATPAAIGRLRRYAKSRARSIARVGGPRRDDYYARELVQDALVDTFTGEVRWEPRDRPLETHIVDVIRYRTRHELVRALHLQHVSLDGTSIEQTGEYFALEEEAAEASNRTPTAAPELRVVVIETMAALRKLAGDDQRVLAILCAIERGATTRDDVLAVTDLSADDYNKGRIRLTALVQDLPDSLRRALKKN